LIGGEIDTPDELRRNDGDNQAFVRFDSITGKFGFRVVGPEANQVWLHEHAPRLLQEREALHKAPPVRAATSVDAFMTKPEVARHLFGVTKLRTAHIVIDRWLEPSAGEGAFFNLLPPDNRLGIDADRGLPGNANDCSLLAGNPQQHGVRRGSSKSFVPRRANLAFAGWHKVLGDAKTTTAMPDALTTDLWGITYSSEHFPPDPKHSRRVRKRFQPCLPDPVSVW
jgi:hypothetical protein